MVRYSPVSGKAIICWFSEIFIQIHRLSIGNIEIQFTTVESILKLGERNMSISKEDSSLTSIPGVWNFEVLVIQRESLEENAQERETLLSFDL